MSPSCPAQKDLFSHQQHFSLIRTRQHIQQMTAVKVFSSQSSPALVKLLSAPSSTGCEWVCVRACVWCSRGLTSEQRRRNILAPLRYRIKALADSSGVWAVLTVCGGRYWRVQACVCVKQNTRQRCDGVLSEQIYSVHLSQVVNKMIF